MKKLICLIMFFVLIASCSSDKDTKVELPDNNIEKTNNNSYIYELDMSYMSAGVYLVKMGNPTIGYKTGRIIVK